MPMPPVHFAVGMGISAVLGAVVGAVRRRWLIYVPLVMSVCGGLALVPDMLAGDATHVGGIEQLGERAYSHGRAMNLFFLHPWLDGMARLETREVTARAFHLVALGYLVSMCGYVAFIRWGVPRMKESGEALARMGAKARLYGPAGVLAGIVPLLMLGGAVGWATRAAGPPGPSAQGVAEREERRWSGLVQRRLRLEPGQHLGLVSGPRWQKGEWLVGDVGACSTFGGGAAELAAVVERAQANRCDFVVLADGAGLGTPQRVAAYARALDAARERFRDTTVLAGLAWTVARRPGGGGEPQASVLVPPQAREGELLGAFARRFDRGGPRGAAEPRVVDPAELGCAALRWLKAHSRSLAAAPAVLASATGEEGLSWQELCSWLHANEVFLGIVGLRGGERGSTRGRWDPRVAEVGGTWDQLLDRGFRVRAAVAASGLRDPARHYWPGERVRTHVWCRGRRATHVLEGLRAGRSWADEDGMVRSVELELVAPLLKRPAGMGDVVRVAPGAELSVELRLDIPERDLAGREGRVDEVEVISNVDGSPRVVERFRQVRSLRSLRLVLPPAADHNGGVGFYVRARGRRRLRDGSERFFYTNPIRVLVRAGTKPPWAVEKPPPTRVVARPRPGEGPPPKPKPKPEPIPPTTAQGPATTPVAERVDPLDAIGLPRGVHVVQMETFARRPGRQWRGTWTSNVADRGPALGDDRLQMSYVREIALGEATRLFFRCRGTECGQLTVLLRTSRSRKPYQRVFELPEDKWRELDVSLREDFHPPLGAPGRLGPGDGTAGREGDVVEAIEWRAEGRGARAGFFVTDFVVYERTRTARVAFARRRAGEPRGRGKGRRAGELERSLVVASSLGAPSRAWQQRADAVARRLAACQERLHRAGKLAVFRELGALEHELDELAAEIGRLRLQATMARAFAVGDPPFVVGLASATQRVSARNPALGGAPEVAKAHELWAAAGEAESFQILVQALWQPLRAVDVTWSDLRPDHGRGPGLPSSALSAAVAGERWVYPRADLPRSRTGWMPDPLIPFLPFDVEPGALRAVVLTVRVPPDLPPGDYSGTVRVQPMGHEAVTLAVRLHRWDFALVGGHFAVVGAIDGRALRDQYGDEGAAAAARRRQLYELLLRHRVCPVPVLGRSEEANLADMAFCLERGAGLAVAHQAPSLATAGADPGVARAARYASKLREAGHGSRVAVVLPLARGGTPLLQWLRSLKLLNKRHPGLLLVAGGEGEPPGGLAADYWRRPLGLEELRRPGEEALEVRRARSTRREAWHLGAAAADYPNANLTLANRLVESRALSWLAWRHGVRALFLDGVNRWGEGASGRDVLVYPGPAGDLYGSMRLVALRDGVEDYECLWLLWDRARRLRDRAPARHLGLLAAVAQARSALDRGLGTMAYPPSDPGGLAALRVRLGRLVERLEAAWWAEVDGSKDLPPPPPRLAATAGDGRVTLSWPRSPEERVAAYHVYRSREPKVGFARVTQRPVAALTYDDSPVANGVPHYYFVRSCLEGDVEGPRSKVVDATPRPAPKVAWEPMADLTRASEGPYRVALRLTGPGTGGALPLVRPQIDYCLSDGFYDGFEEMTRRDDGVWTFAIPALDWRRNASKRLRYKVRIVNRRNRVVSPAVEREELIDAAARPRPE